MSTNTGKRTAKVRTTLSKRTIDALEPADKPWIAWDDKLTGFGVRIHPSGTKAFIVNYRAGEGGRKAPNKRVVIGRYGKVSPDQARRMAQELLGKVAGGRDPAEERAEARAMPTLGDAFEDYMEANPNRRTAPFKFLWRQHAEQHKLPNGHLIPLTLARWSHALFALPLNTLQRNPAQPHELTARF